MAKKNFIREYNTKVEYKETQKKLRKENNIADENIVVVEKKNSFLSYLKFAISIISSVIKIIATIAIILLAIIGLASIIYPEPRSQLLIILNQIIDQYFSFLR